MQKLNSKFSSNFTEKTIHGLFKETEYSFWTTSMTRKSGFREKIKIDIFTELHHSESKILCSESKCASILDAIKNLCTS